MKKIQLYESLIDIHLKQELEKLTDQSQIHTEKLDANTSSNYFATYIEHVVNHAFRHLKSEVGDLERQIEISNQIIETLSRLVEDESIHTMRIVDENLLRGITEKSITPQNFKDFIPQTSIARSSLFTGNIHEPQVYSELKKEIATADRVDLLVSFIKYSGLRLIYDDLVEHTKTKPLRVITTSYMGASDFKAIKSLAELPNTEVKVSYDTERTRLHAKAYYFERTTGFSTAYIGSSNLSKAALSEGTEWNLKISEYLSPEIIHKYLVTFETYWNTPEFMTFDPNSLEDAHKLKKALDYNGTSMDDSFFFDLSPFAYQQEILDRLEIEREVFGSYKNLIIAATGTGKTMVSAFDFKRFYAENPNAKLLFLAHREEILKQSLKAFRGVLRDNNFGELWVSQYQPTINQQIFASIQTLNSNDQYLDFDRDYFDYIVLDETHHAAAKSYKRILDHFEPKILLGLTATPERLDGENIVDDFNNRIAYEIRLGEAIQRNLLCPFHYFAVTDETDISQVIWKNGKYDTETLNTRFIGNIVRDNAIVKAIDKYLPDLESIKGLGFCTSVEHAAYMAKCFNERHIPSINLDGKSDKITRESVQDKLKNGEIKFIFVVDLYNEGVDIPEINTVLFLRPTDSPTIFTQQLGRGLRLHPSKSVLTVLDFIGQAHKQYDFSMKFQSLIGKTKHPIITEIERDFPTVPRNCVIQFERVAKEIVLKNLKQMQNDLRRFRRLITQYAYQSAQELTVGNFFKFYNIAPLDFYSSTTMEILCAEASVEYGLRNDDENTSNLSFKNEVEFYLTKAQKQNFLYKVCQSNAYQWLKEVSSFLTTTKVMNEVTEHKFLLMLFYMLPAELTKKAPEAFGDEREYLIRLFEVQPFLKQELLELITYKLQSINHMPKVIGEGHIPLELHADYSIDHILTIFGENTYGYKKPMREGVFFVKAENTDLFFITLKKSENQFSETTMYEDYAINESLFHWQSQSRTSHTSPTGQRYINGKSKVVLFVRDHKEDANHKTQVYTCLGYARRVEHRGTAPISITYALEEKMPMAVVRSSNQLVDII